jgi:hypothetical protein
MDWLIWLIVIVVIVAVVWWLLNRNSRSAARSSEAGTVTGSGASPTAPPGGERHDGALSGGSAAASAVAAGTTGIPSAAGFGNAEPVAPRTAQEEPVAAREQAGQPAAGTGTVQPAAGSGQAQAGMPHEQAGAGQEQAEWETQWSETPPAEPHAAVHHEPSSGASAVQEDRATPAGADAAGAANAPVHHPEYTQSHAPTLPGAESAAAEASLLEEQDTPSDGLASHRAEPAGHLALAQPYGEGSAAPTADGSAPEGFTVKGDASSMTYHDESSPSYEETAAGVWFMSVAHAEAAGFRPPRRVRL